ncbi:hypothetical protein [Streptomyces sp. NPDC050388]|uniref:hypothetical protein n=1 Tax=Streptomyces sp. NPDC050388 TaxID=3155781 RepID=UPI00343D2932
MAFTKAPPISDVRQSESSTAATRSRSCTARTAGTAVSLDGFIADDHDEVGPLRLVRHGDVRWTFPGGDDECRTPRASVARRRARSSAVSRLLRSMPASGRALRLGLIDQVVVYLVPVLFGSGSRLATGLSRVRSDECLAVEGVDPVRAAVVRVRVLGWCPLLEQTTKCFRRILWRERSTASDV